MVQEETATRLQDITGYKVHYKPRGARVALWDCPKVIRDAALGRPPELSRVPPMETLRFMWRELLAFSCLLGLTEYFIVSAVPGFAWAAGFVAVSCFLLLLIMIPVLGMKDDERVYGIRKELYDAFAANPDLYRDEIFKHAVERLNWLDFYGRHRALDEAQVGRYEREVIEAFRRFGIRQETSVANRGRPFLIHQYELTELGWGKWENGATKNYTLDLAILWPERRIKYNVEVDDPTHRETARQLRDVNRDEVLTRRGWFVRRLNHNYIIEGLESGKLDTAIKDIIGVVYFFAKYANTEELGFEHRLYNAINNRKFKVVDAKLRGKQTAKLNVAQAGDVLGSQEGASRSLESRLPSNE